MKEIPVLERLREEVRRIERELRVELPKELQKAAAHGDLRENAEYQAAKERQSYLNARLVHLTQRIHALASIKLDDIPQDRIAFGSRIYLEDIETGREVVYELVTPEEVAPKEGKISVSSPIGRELLGKQEGDLITIHLPSGTKEYEVCRIETLHDLLGEDL